MVYCEFEGGFGGFTGLGKRGKPMEEVAYEPCIEFKNWNKGDAERQCPECGVRLLTREFPVTDVPPRVTPCTAPFHLYGQSSSRFRYCVACSKQEGRPFLVRVAA